MMTILWLAIVAVMLIIEIFTLGLTTIWFSLGAISAAIAAGLGAPLWIQYVLFTGVSVIIRVLVRPFAMKYIDKNRTKTNIEEVLGEQVEVIENIKNQKEQGKVRFRGVEWMARSVDGTEIPVGKMVTVESVSGVKLIVRNAAE